MNHAKDFIVTPPANDWRDNLEAFNRATASDALRELQLAPNDDAPIGANKALDVIAGIPRHEWIDAGYAVMIPSVLLIGLPLLILWIRP